jgi:hypothetical protein
MPSAVVLLLMDALKFDEQPYFDCSDFMTLQRRTAQRSLLRKVLRLWFSPRKLRKLETIPFSYLQLNFRCREHFALFCLVTCVTWLNEGKAISPLILIGRTRCSDRVFDSSQDYATSHRILCCNTQVSNVAETQRAPSPEAIILLVSQARIQIDLPVDVTSSRSTFSVSRSSNQSRREAAEQPQSSETIQRTVDQTSKSQQPEATCCDTIQIS